MSLTLQSSAAHFFTLFFLFFRGKSVPLDSSSIVTYSNFLVFGVWIRQIFVVDLLTSFMTLSLFEQFLCFDLFFVSIDVTPYFKIRSSVRPKLRKFECSRDILIFFSRSLTLPLIKIDSNEFWVIGWNWKLSAQTKRLSFTPEQYHNRCTY